MTQVMASRAVAKTISPGQSYECAWAECASKPVKFQARNRMKAIITNVYVAGRWDRVEVFHPSCYQAAGEPHGAVDHSRSDLLIK